MNVRIRDRILIPTAGVFLVTLAAVIAFSYITADRIIQAEIKGRGDEMAGSVASAVKAKLENGLFTVKGMARAFEGAYKAGLRDRDALSRLLRPLLEHDASALAVWVFLEPGVMGDEAARSAPSDLRTETGRFATAWTYAGASRAVTRVPWTEEAGKAPYIERCRSERTDVMVQPFASSATGKKEDEKFYSGFATPLVVDGRLIGVMGTTIAIASIAEIVSSYSPIPDSYTIMTDNEGKRVVHPNPELIGKQVGHDIPDRQAENLAAIASGGVFSVSKKNLKTGELSYLRYAPVRVGSDGSPWSVALVLPLSRMLEPLRRLLFLMLGIGALGLAAGSAVIVIVATGVARPVRLAQGYMEAIASGDLRVRPEAAVLARGDEVGGLARALDSMAARLLDVVA